MNGRIALPAALIGALLAGLVVIGACALLLLFNFARATENLAFGGGITAGAGIDSGAPVPATAAAGALSRPRSPGKDGPGPGWDGPGWDGPAWALTRSPRRGGRPGPAGRVRRGQGVRRRRR